MPHETRHPAAEPIRADLAGGDRCSALGLTARGHAPVLRLCQLLVEAGIDPTLTLEAYRGSTLCLTVCSLAEGAALEVRPGRNTGTPVFIRTSRGSARAASPVPPKAKGVLGTLVGVHPRPRRMRPRRDHPRELHARRLRRAS